MHVHLRLSNRASSSICIHYIIYVFMDVRVGDLACGQKCCGSGKTGGVATFSRDAYGERCCRPGPGAGLVAGGVGRGEFDALALAVAVLPAWAEPTDDLIAPIAQGP